KLRFAHMAPRKLRRVADAIRGKSVKEALVVLRFAGVFAAAPLEKLLRSAVSNAENNHNMSGDDLYVRRIMVDGGPGGRFTKRLDPRAQGRAAFKRRRMSHVIIVVGDRPKKAEPRRKGGASVAMRSQERRLAAAAEPQAKKKAAPRKRTARKKATTA
ncbi:MAG: 50S ribosomal protein L22, partial [Vulcanimicrobiaceae bacterium]